MGGSPSILSLIQFIGGDKPFHSVFWGAICAAVGMTLAFVITFILFKDEETAAPAVESERLDAVNAAVDGKEAPAKKLAPKSVEIDAPMNGTVVPLKEVPDEVFATGILGEGVAIQPSDGKVYAPCDAAVAQLMDSGHAIGLVADSGVEILIHVGLETVGLGGKPFTYHVKADQEVKKGDLLLTADLKAIEQAGCKTITPVIISNSVDYANVDPVNAGEIKAGQKLMTLS
jgi:PTS system beta-glucosides-specific IIC component